MEKLSHLIKAVLKKGNKKHEEPLEIRAGQVPTTLTMRDQAPAFGSSSY